MSYIRVAIVQNKPGTIEESVKRATDSLLPLFQKMPGFISYRIIQSDKDRGVSLAEWETAEQAKASIETARTWGRENNSDLQTSMESFAGELVLESLGIRPSGMGVVEALFGAFNRKDFSRLDQVVAPGAKVLNIAEGRELPLREDYENWAKAFPDGQVELVRAAEGYETIFVEYIGRGTQTGTLRTSMGTIEPTNRRVELRLVDVTTLHDGKVTGIKTFFDVTSLLRQLGIELVTTGVSPPPSRAEQRPEARH